MSRKTRAAGLCYSLVAADALVPSSFTSILAFCRALDTNTGSAPGETNGVRHGAFGPHGGAAAPNTPGPLSFRFFLLLPSTGNVLLSSLTVHRRVDILRLPFYFNKRVTHWLVPGCFYSLRCLKSARSTLNMSVTPRAERDSFRSTWASAENLDAITRSRRCQSGGQRFQGGWGWGGLTLGRAGGSSSRASAWPSSAPWPC